MSYKLWSRSPARSPHSHLRSLHPYLVLYGTRSLLTEQESVLLHPTGGAGPDDLFRTGGTAHRREPSGNRIAPSYAQDRPTMYVMSMCLSVYLDLMSIWIASVLCGVVGDDSGVNIVGLLLFDSLLVSLLDSVAIVC